MKLKIEHGDDILDATSDDVSRAIQEILRRGEGFVVLGSAEQHYIQAQGGRDYPFMLEYREGSWESHYQATEQTISASDVERAMRKYLAGDDSWKESFTWVLSEDANSKNGCLGVALLFTAPSVYGLFWVLQDFAT